jgi:hypothetical protein
VASWDLKKFFANSLLPQFFRAPQWFYPFLFTPYLLLCA